MNTRRLLATLSSLGLLLVAATGCGGAERVLGDPVASGEFVDGTLWTVRTADDGTVCVRVTTRDGTARGDGCVPLTATWLIGTVDIDQNEKVVVAALPSCVSAVALSGADERTTATTLFDEISFGVVGPLRDGEEESATLIGLRWDSSPIFELDRVDDDPSERIPPIAC